MAHMGLIISSTDRSDWDSQRGQPLIMGFEIEAYRTSGDKKQ